MTGWPRGDGRSLLAVVAAVHATPAPVDYGWECTLTLARPPGSLGVYLSLSSLVGGRGRHVLAVTGARSTVLRSCS